MYTSVLRRDSQKAKGHHIKKHNSLTFPQGNRVGKFRILERTKKYVISFLTSWKTNMDNHEMI